MNYLHLSTPRRFGILAIAGVLGVFCAQQCLAAAPPPVGSFPRQKAVVARAALLPGALLRRDGDAWKPLLPQAEIYDGDLIVGFPAGLINSKDRNVRLVLLSDLARISPYPVLESAVILHETDLDLDFTLDRGRVDLANMRRTGESKVRIRFQKQVWELTLGEKARVAFELYGRWPAGTSFSKTPKPDESPTIDVVMLVKVGSVHLKADGKEYEMAAPPGAAYFHWDSVPPFDDTPQFLKSLPKWTEPISQLPNMADIVGLINTIRKRAQEKSSSLEDAISSMLTDDSPATRRIAVYGLGALDDLPQLIDTLSTSKIPDVRDTCVIALRHWIGRGQGQDQKLYAALLKKGFSESQATKFMQLLHSFGNQQKASPGTYETLIDLLQNENPAIRELASWHLTRLVPKGQDIKFDALATAEERQKGYEKWKELIPAGKLPPK
jgi:hypothetical protein